jgi:predicted amidohydrolase YtcJ
MRNYFSVSIFLIFILFSCSSSKKEKVDLLIHNAVIYTVDSTFSVQEAMVVRDGKILATGTDEEIFKLYSATDTLDVQKKTIFPGFIDAHCHFVAYGLGLNRVDLTGTKSFEEVLSRVKDFALTNPDTSWIIGRGWDQNDWAEKKYPNNTKLDSLFPNRPILLTRVDGHAALVNSAGLKRAGIDQKTKIFGGAILSSDKGPTGILIDRALDLVNKTIPRAQKAELKKALLKAQKNCLAVGLTTIDEAGLMKIDIDLIDTLQKSGQLKMRVYAMLSDSLPNYEYYLDRGPYKTERLHVRSFKFYADGALGSRGACLIKDYSDKPGWKGFLITKKERLEKYAAILDKKGFQMNSHCIGDSASRLVLQIYNKYANKKNEHRWRIEHAQVIDAADVKKFNSDIIPSVQPTHATSDMYWAEARLGKERLKNAYIYKEQLNASGLIALGTDFPVEDISPFKTFYATVARKDDKGFPENGFQIENALSREETLRGMTIWAAYANFEEHEKGSLEKGKFADFIVLDNNLMNCALPEVLKTQVLATYINGEKVFAGK